MALTKVQKEGIETLINNNADNRVITGSGTANTLNGESDVIVDSSGNLGIGAGTPRQKLHISASDSSSVNMVFTNSTTGTSAGDGFIVGITGGEDAQLNMQESANLKFSTADTERMRINSSGDVGIGTTSPAELLHLQSTAGNTKLRLTQSGSTTDAVNGAIHFGNSTDGQLCEIRGYTSGSNNSGYLQFRTTNSGSDVNAMTINTAGNLGIGTSSPQTPLHVYHSTINGAATFESGDEYVHINFKDSTTTNEPYIGAQGNNLRAITGGAERMRIDSSGKVGIGVTDPTRTIDAHVTDSGSNYLHLTNSSTGTGDGNGVFIGLDSAEGGIIWNQENAYVRFGTNDSERMRITSDGKVGIGTTSPAYRLDIPIAGTVAARLRQTTNNQGDDHALMICRHSAARSGSNGVDFLFQNDSGSTVGKIDHGQSTTQYRTSSDYRLKENAVDISDGITRLKTLKPYRFNFKLEPDKTVDGFFAHEVTAVPEAISGTKDEVDSDNNPVYQGIDHSKLVPLLTAALQEEISKREALETRVAALEAA